MDHDNDDYERNGREEKIPFHLLRSARKTKFVQSGQQASSHTPQYRAAVLKKHLNKNTSSSSSLHTFNHYSKDLISVQAPVQVENTSLASLESPCLKTVQTNNLSEKIILGRG